MLNSALAGARDLGRRLAISCTVHEQMQSNQACNIFSFAVFVFFAVLFDFLSISFDLGIHIIAKINIII
jgi:hypothetical protein